MWCWRKREGFEGLGYAPLLPLPPVLLLVGGSVVVEVRHGGGGSILMKRQWVEFGSLWNLRFFCDIEYPLCNIYLFSHPFLRENLFSKSSGATSGQVSLVIVFFH